MTQVVNVPGVGKLNFPDGMSQADMAAAIQKNFPQVSKPAPPVDAPAAGGMGYNPMLGRLASASIAGGKELGMTPENVSNPMLNMLGPLETGAQLVTGTGATILGGVAGLAQGAWNMAVPKHLEGQQAGDAVREVQDKLTYQPRTGMGAGMSRVAGFPMEIYSKGTDRLGEGVSSVTGSPLAGAIVKTGLDAAPSLVSRGRVPEFKAQPKGKYTPTKFDVPTTEQLTKASKEAYAANKDAGIMVPSAGYAKALEGVQKVAREEGLDPTLHPGSTAVMKRLEEAGGRDLTLQEAETLRKIALDAEDSLNPVTRQPTPDARLAGKIVDELDERIEALSTNDQARALWARSRRSQMIDTMIHRAEIKAGAHYTQAGMEHALRQEFKQLALNPRRMRGLTAEQRAAVEKVAKGGPTENTLRVLGKFDPTAGVIPAMASLATGGVMAPIGFASRRLATKATSHNVDLARESLVGRGMPNVAQPTKGSPTLPIEVAQALIAKQGTRSSATIRSDIQALIQRAGAQAGGPASPQARAIFLELERLEAELKAAQQRELSQGASGAPLSQ